MLAVGVASTGSGLLEAGSTAGSGAAWSPAARLCVSQYCHTRQHGGKLACAVPTKALLGWDLCIAQLHRVCSGSTDALHSFILTGAWVSSAHYMPL